MVKHGSGGFEHCPCISERGRSWCALYFGACVLERPSGWRLSDIQKEKKEMNEWRVYVSYFSATNLAYLVTTHVSWEYALHYGHRRAIESGLKHYIRKNTGAPYIKLIP